MAEYIEREKITDILETAIDLQGAVMLMLRAEEDPEMKGERKAYKDILKGVKEIPAGDVEERKTAQWIPSGIPNSILDKCSGCGFDTGANTFHFCPMCGAKMKKLIKVDELEQGADPGYPPFGSYGDSVTIDEVVKQSKTIPDVRDISSWPTANPTYGDNCWARLPCGICRNTMMQCPLSLMQPTWSWSSSTATNQTGGEA